MTIIMLRTIYFLKGSIRLKSTLNYSKVPKLSECDFEEKFIRGNGPGGSKTNKKANCVFLKHTETGISVKCHKARDLQDNRKMAREMLIAKLDNLFNKENSIESQIKAIEKRKALASIYKRNKLKMSQDEWKKREGLVDELI